MFIQTLRMMLRNDFTHQTMTLIDHYQQGKTKKGTRIMKDELDRKIMTKHFELRPEVSSKRYKKDYKNCLKMMFKC